MNGEQLPQRKNIGIEGEVIGADELDPMLERKFSELPEPVASWYKTYDLRLRRLIIGDEELLTKTPEELIDLFTFANPEYQTPAQQAGFEEVDTFLDSTSATLPQHDPALDAKDITPQSTPEKPAIDDSGARKRLEKPE